MLFVRAGVCGVGGVGQVARQEAADAGTHVSLGLFTGPTCDTTILEVASERWRWSGVQKVREGGKRVGSLWALQERRQGGDAYTLYSIARCEGRGPVDEARQYDGDHGVLGS